MIDLKGIKEERILFLKKLDAWHVFMQRVLDNLYEENIFNLFNFCNCFISDQKSLGQNTSMIDCLESFKSLIYEISSYVCLKKTFVCSCIYIWDHISRCVIYNNVWIFVDAACGYVRAFMCVYWKIRNYGEFLRWNTLNFNELGYNDIIWMVWFE